MNKKIVFGVSAVALATFLMAPSASAACAGPRTASTYNFSTGAAPYWHAPGGDTDASGSLAGQTWQLGAPATWSTGSCGGSMFYFGPGGIGLSFDMSTCGTGCPTSGSTLAVLAQKRNNTGGSDFLLATVVETPSGAVNFDYSTQPEHTMIPIPRPRVTASARTAPNVNLSIGIDSIADGLFGPNAASAVVGYRILGKSAPLASSGPGSAASDYDAAPRAVIAAPGGVGGATPLTVDCSNIANDQFLAVQLQFEGGIFSDSVSAATRVRCDPAVANPRTPKIKIAPKKGTVAN